MSGRTGTPWRSPSDPARSAGGGAGTALEYAVAFHTQSHTPVPVLPPPFQHQGTTMADEWPLQNFIELGALATAVGCARLHVRQLLWEWGVTELSEPLELIVSELLTNAVKASQTMENRPPVRLWLLSDKARVLVLVWDANPQPPIQADVDLESESGRGLLLVESLSDKWDW